MIEKRIPGGGKLKMSPALLKIHNECVELCQTYVKSELKIVAKLQLVARHKIFRDLKKRNLFVYASEVCGLSRAQAYTFTSLAKKSNEHQELSAAIRSGELSIHKAARLVSVIQESNAAEIVEFAKTHTSREIEREVRRINPKAAEPQKISPLAEKVDLLHCPIDLETSEYIRKAQALIAQKTKSHKDLRKQFI